MRFINHTFLALILLLSIETGQCQHQVTLENDLLKVQISTLGAELQSIYGNESNLEYLWQGDSNYWAARSPIMFPVNVRFRDDRFTYNGKTYEMPRRGLADKANYDVENQNDHSVVLTFKSSEETLRYYPFHFVFKVSYILEDNRLINTFEIKNTGNDTMYYALGGHPGFRFPFGGSRADYSYTFDDEYLLNRTEVLNSLVQNREIPFLQNESGFPLSDPRVPDGGMFVKKMPSKWVGMSYRENDPFVLVELSEFPNVNLWSPPGMPYACIEPMVGHHDEQHGSEDITEKEFLKTLSTAETVSYSYTIQITSTK